MSDPFARPSTEDASAPSPQSRSERSPSLGYTPGEFVVLRDPLPWAQPARLSGVLERQRFHPLLSALLTFIGGFVLYQLVGTIVMVVVALGGVEGTPDTAAIMEAVQSNAVALFGGNALGQLAGFCLFVVFVTWLHTPNVGPYLRIRKMDVVHLALVVGGLVVLTPLVSWLGQVNASIPLPPSLEAWDEQQAALLEQVFGADLNVFYALLVIALTPAVCEEVMFRGYLQRQVERRMGVVWSIVLVGLLFGLFHLRPSQVLPLTALGLYLGFVVWVTGSLWAGFVVHLLNNGLAVLVSDWASRSGDMDPVALESITVPWYLALASAAAVTGVVYGLHRRRRDLLRDPLRGSSARSSESFG